MVTDNTRVLTEVPANPDSHDQYIFYLHGLIVEEAGIRPKSEEHGYYEYELILDQLAQEGFTVISETRPQGTQIKDYAEKVVAQIRLLLKAGVPPENITVVGASKGGVISAYVSAILQEEMLNFVFLAGLFEKCLKDEDLVLYGNVLSIHDRADTQSITPEKYFQRSPGLHRAKAMVFSLDVGHGLIYKPYREWIEPLLEWVRPGK